MLLLLLILFPLALCQSPLTKAWNEALPGVQPFWEKYQTGPHGVVIRGWQFSRCASEQVSFFSCTARSLTSRKQHDVREEKLGSVGGVSARLFWTIRDTIEINQFISI
ncbi:unnamed protein product [Strongylus vulgaris]|uniref:Uncharacterized protein n=1 Tax=Strongylus vulgaris TaxID=40348 RepID=A0A3P7IWA2_STRVU|nr:unnamed protein product [Strongylus vulgaris]